MKLRSLLLATFVLLATAAIAADITGNWQVTISAPTLEGGMSTDMGVAMLKQTGDVVTGSVGPDEKGQWVISEGSFKDNKILFKASPRPDRIMTFELTILGEKLVGTVKRTGDERTATVEFVRSVKK